MSFGTLDEMMISPGIFFSCFQFFFYIFIFWLLGAKGQKMAQEHKKTLSVAVDISGTLYHMIVIYGTLL